ncbi:MAG: hypothetical protein JSS75_01020 [Bacteroidetes bacterium]|nr:hypothetical protein [Bacteroidota bacterium]
MTYRRNAKVALFCAIALVFATVQSSFAQPLVDSVRALQKQNDRMYRVLSSLDDQGGSYAYTNVVQWKITDPELYGQLKDALQKEPFNLKPDEVDITDIYMFSAPIPGTDRVQPFHILAMGIRKEKTKGKRKTSVLDAFGGGDEDNSQPVPFPFKGKALVKYLVQNKTLLDNINSIGGEFVELPGEIIPHGAQLVKDSRVRYMYNRMFSQFYSKVGMQDEQRRVLGLPTSQEAFAAPAVNPNDTTGGAQQDIPLIDPEATTALPEQSSFLQRASRYEKLVDLSINHLWVNVTKQLSLELELGHSEVGLPFWSTGEARFWINMKNQIGSESNVKLGLVFPLDFGNKDAFTFPARRLSGSWGGSLDAYFAGIDFFSAFNLPLALKLSIMPGGGSNSSILNDTWSTAGKSDVAFTTLAGKDTVIPASRTFYRTTVVAQLYIPTILQLDLNNFLQVSAGIGILNVEQSMLPKGTGYDYTRNRPGDQPLFTPDQVDKVQDLKRVSAPVSPHFMVEYVNHKNSKFGLSAGYDHEFMFGGWIELIQDHFRIELNYSSPLIRDAKAWEPQSFFSITPRFYF